MDRKDLVRMLEDLRMERTEAEHQLATLQRRVDALRKAADGMEDLLASDNAQGSDSPIGVQASEASAVSPDTTASAETVEVLKTPHHGLKEPSGGQAALIVLKGEPNRFLTVREVWEEQVRRGWAADTKDSRAAVRVALVRLAQRDPSVDRLDGPTTAYRWSSGSSSFNGSSLAARAN